MLEAIKTRLSAGGLKLDPRLGMLAIAAIAALVAVSVVVYLWRDQGSFRALYGAGESFPVAEVMQVLDTEGVKYRLHPQSGQILVYEDQLAQARMMLTAKGVQVAVPAGYELFDKEEPLGTSQFVQDVRLKRSLEGELARTIMALKGVDSARVHLALSENSSFVISKRQPAKASIMLQLTAGYRLTPDQVVAVVDLVSNSVPQLEKTNISVVDQHGVLLSRGLNHSSGPVQNWQLVDDFQAKAVTNVEQVLAPVLGSGNYRVSVSAEINFSQREETLQTYGDVPHLRNEILRDESVLDQLALGVPGSLSNRPAVAPTANNNDAADEDGGVETDNQAATSLRKESNRQMDYDQSITHIKHAPFALVRQSIAVVLNADSAPEGGWTPEAQANLEAMVKSAAGFNEARGDLLTLSFFPFTAATLPVEVTPWWQTKQVHDLAKLGLLGLFSLLLLLTVVRPVLRNLISASRAKAEARDDSVALINERAEAMRKGPLMVEANTPNILGELNPLSEIRLPAPGSGLELQMEHLQMLAQNDPERVSEVIKQWIGRNERDLNPV